MCCVPDIDECSSLPAVCTNGRCINMAGGFRCECHSGYRPSADHHRCIGQCLYLSRFDIAVYVCGLITSAAPEKNWIKLCPQRAQTSPRPLHQWRPLPSKNISYQAISPNVKGRWKSDRITSGFGSTPKFNHF